MKSQTIVTIGFFLVTSYQANFASHHTWDRRVSFHLHGTVLGKATKCFITFYLVGTTLLNCNWVARISPDRLGKNYKSFHEVNRKSKGFLLFFSILRCTKGNQEVLNACVNAYHIVQTLYSQLWLVRSCSCIIWGRYLKECTKWLPKDTGISKNEILVPSF